MAPNGAPGLLTSLALSRRLAPDSRPAIALPAPVPGGGYIYDSDHSVPSEVSFEHCCHAVELVMEYGSTDGERTSSHTTV